MSDQIIYSLVTQCGGVDGRDHTDKGGKTIAVALTRVELENNPSWPWCDIMPSVADLAEVARCAMAQLTPLQRLAIRQMKGTRA